MYINGKGAKSWFKLNISVLLPSKHWPWKDLSLTIQGPTILGILGPNGAGKSTPNQGHARTSPHGERSSLDQKDLNQVLQRVAYVEQEIRYWFPLPITVRESASHWVFIPNFLSSREKAKKISKRWNALKLVNLLDPSGSPDPPSFQETNSNGCSDRPLHGQEADVILDRALPRDWLCAKTSCRPSDLETKRDHSDRPSRPQQGPPN